MIPLWFSFESQYCKLCSVLHIENTFFGSESVGFHAHNFTLIETCPVSEHRHFPARKIFNTFFPSEGDE